MEQNTKAIISMDRKKEKDIYSSQMGQNIKGNLRTMLLKDEEFINGLMGGSMKANGGRIKCMDMVK